MGGGHPRPFSEAPDQTLLGLGREAAVDAGDEAAGVDRDAGSQHGIGEAEAAATTRSLRGTRPSAGSAARIRGVGS